MVSNGVKWSEMERSGDVLSNSLPFSDKIPRISLITWNIAIKMQCFPKKGGFRKSLNISELFELAPREIRGFYNCQ